MPYADSAPLAVEAAEARHAEDLSRICRTACRRPTRTSSTPTSSPSSRPDPARRGGGRLRATLTSSRHRAEKRLGHGRRSIDRSYRHGPWPHPMPSVRLRRARRPRFRPGAHAGRYPRFVILRSVEGPSRGVGSAPPGARASARRRHRPAAAVEARSAGGVPGDGGFDASASRSERGGWRREVGRRCAAHDRPGARQDAGEDERTRGAHARASGRDPPLLRLPQPRAAGPVRRADAPAGARAGRAGRGGHGGGSDDGEGRDGAGRTRWRRRPRRRASPRRRGRRSSCRDERRA